MPESTQAKQKTDEFDDDFVDGRALAVDCDAAVGPTTEADLVHLSAPGSMSNHPTSSATYWLGFRLSSSPWPGYFRIGFAADLGFNSATIDIHHSEFDRLREGIDRLASGHPAGIHFNTPAEVLTPRFRRAIGAMLLQPSPPLTVIQILGLEYEPVLTVNGLMPDVRRGMVRASELLDEVREGPPRRALRRYDLAEEMFVPESWAHPEDLDPGLSAAITDRADRTHNEVRVSLEKAVAVVRGEAVQADSLDFDFTDWPVLLALRVIDARGRDRIEMARLMWPDVQAMRTSFDSPLLPLRASGHLAVQIPPADRAALIDTIERHFSECEAEAIARPFRAKELQMNLPLPEDPAQVLARRARPPMPPPELRQEEQLDLFSCRSVSSHTLLRTGRQSSVPIELHSIGPT